MIFIPKLCFAAVMLLHSLLCANTEKILVPPHIINQPTSDTIYVNSIGESKPFILNCEATGEPTIRYYWKKNGENFEKNGYVTQQIGKGTLIFNKFDNSDEGQYQCFAENYLGLASSNLISVYKSELKSFEDMPPLTLTGIEGEPFKINCNSPYGKPKPKIYWVIRDTTTDAVKSINNSRITVDPEGSLWFSHLTKEDASNNFLYTCAVTSHDRLEYKLGNKVYLNVIASNTSSALNQSQPVLQYVSNEYLITIRDKTVELYCIFGGSPLPVTVWSKDGIAIKYSDHISHQNYGKSLRIKDVDETDRGVYTCEVSNGVGENKLYSINLIVLVIPTSTEEPKSLNGSHQDESI